ncbi:MAG: hypothetical protein A3I86_02715 [Candidatus Zambryskibacteria bacterium RIFCSPLOWO2_02_FULL_39_14]|uniref:Uncharacterized protein n=1 Tax=Candidatus Zambryskibacteria bacterium RIFCSPLOWO2_02_FULL_39_14 TaxID=1802769 RepID=A0A1G2UGH6_9BACT|nr:MAG: hypothetical protein A3I86_02715 [Candidatus Zambryskibacteria bacterium RIFCSPLOWO2_02_FULL_39_14]
MKRLMTNKQQSTIRIRFFILLFILGSWLLVGTQSVYAQDFNLIVCGTDALGECTLSDLVTLLQRLINALIIISTFLATIAFAYAGFLLLTSGGNEGSKTKAKDIFIKVLMGYLWILGAWLIVYTISSVLLRPGFSLISAL